LRAAHKLSFLKEAGVEKFSTPAHATSHKLPQGNVTMYKILLIIVTIQKGKIWHFYGKFWKK